MRIEDYEKIFPTATVTTPGGDIRFHIPNSACAWRVQTLMSKEPDTIAWVNEMKPGDTLFDVGANMGQYSLYAASRGVIVHAFEPDSQNFALLCRNLMLNPKLAERVTAWPIALSNETKLSMFHVTALQYGGSCHAFDKPMAFNGTSKEFAFRHGAVGFTMADFCSEQLVYPTHIKIDVDGLEPSVISGMSPIMGNDTMRTILVELNSNLPDHMCLFDTMRGAGFGWDVGQVAASRRSEGPFTGIGNVIFRRP